MPAGAQLTDLARRADGFERCSAQPVVFVDSVTRTFGARHALTDVSICFGRGEIHALLGANGAGKTTLLRILSGLLAPSTGNVLVAGMDPRRQSRALRRVVGLVPSGDRSLYLRISGFENLLFFGRLHGLPRRAAATRARELLELVGLADAADRRVGIYSHGMRRRLAVARALLADPRVLLVDEATHDLDPEGASEVRGLVEASAAAGATVLWATQRLDEIRGFATRATLLAAGRVRFVGSVADLLDHAVPRRFVLRLGDAATDESAAAAIAPYGRVGPVPGASGHVLLVLDRDAILGDALAALTGARVEVLTCSPERSELEEAFLSLTRSVT